MSRAYEADVTIAKIKREDIPRASEVIASEWVAPHEEPYINERSDRRAVSFFNLRSSLCGGESEDEFAIRLTHALWKELGYFVGVEICMTCLEYIPCESYTYDKGEFDAWLAATQDSGE